MTSLKGLVENECGAQNPLLKLTSHFTTDRTLLQQDGLKFVGSTHVGGGGGVGVGVRHVDHESDFVNDYFNNDYHKRKQAPQTFHMENLFNELLNIDKQHTNNLTNISLNKAANDWSNEYTRALPSSTLTQSQQQFSNSSGSNGDLKWSTEYLTQREATIYDDAWESLLRSAPATTNEAQLNDEMRKTANELLESMQDSQFSETEFLQFVKNLKQKETLKNDEEQATETMNDLDEDEKLWSDALKQVEMESKANSMQAPAVAATEMNADQWVNEFEKLKQANNTENFWDDLNDEWTKMSRSNPDHPWLDDFEQIFDSYKTYEFDKENPLATFPNPFEEGLKRLKEHDIVNAVLLFEAAVQKDQTNMLAWQYLGTTQVENEQDAQAIRALKKCLELKKDNLIALSTLATSYTNESMQRLAYDCLYKWLEANTKYAHLVRNKLLPSIPQTQLAALSIVHIKDFLELQEVYLEAVRESSTKVDPDLQCCLGVLFHLSGEFDKAADCFKTALQIKPNDHLLWNKLGATYANSNRNEEAIEAYYNALQLCPGFVRARYNLGIGCMNLGAYKEAVEHFLTALSQQSQANIQQKQNEQNKLNQMSDTIWSTLRLALSYLNRTDLYQSCANKDLDSLKTQFNIE